MYTTGIKLRDTGKVTLYSIANVKTRAYPKASILLYTSNNVATIQISDVSRATTYNTHQMYLSWAALSKL